MQNGMKQFEEQLLRTSIRRFASAGTVPAADTQESIVDACNQTAASVTSSTIFETTTTTNTTTTTRTTATDEESLPVELDVDGKFLTPEQSQMLRDQQDHLWLCAVPPRLRSFLDNKKDTKKLNEAFSEVVVRFPILGAGHDEVVAFCSQFGQCDYVGPCFDSSSSSSSNLSSSRKHCHIVRFERGYDAIKCFVELNGYFIDAQDCRETLNKFVMRAASAAAAAAAAVNDNNDNNDDDNADENSQQQQQQQIPTQEINSFLHVRSAEEFEEEVDDDDADEEHHKKHNTGGQIPNYRHIFITCDFFRSAFYNKRNLAASSNNLIARFTMPTTSVFEELAAQEEQLPSEWNPADIVCKALTTRARELRAIFPLAASHSPEIEWVGFCRAANTILFFIPLSSLVAENSNVWSLTLKSLRLCRISVVALFRALDAARDVDELLDNCRVCALRSDPLEPPSPKRSRRQQNQQDDEHEEENEDVFLRLQQEQERLRNSKAGPPSLVQRFLSRASSVLASPDPLNASSNRIIECAALCVLVIVVLWMLLVTHSMITSEKLRAVGGTDDL